MKIAGEEIAIVDTEDGSTAPFTSFFLEQACKEQELKQKELGTLLAKWWYY